MDVTYNVVVVVVGCCWLLLLLLFFFFKQKTAYEMCGRDWSSDVCSSDLEVVDAFLTRLWAVYEGHPLRIESPVFCDKTGAVNWGSMDCHRPIKKHIVMDCTSPSHSRLDQSYKVVRWAAMKHALRVMKF